MGSDALTRYYTDDHRRLDDLFALYESLAGKQPPVAAKVFREFKAGLERHMAWEETILFPAYDARVRAEGESPTVNLRFEHGQIRDLMAAIEQEGGTQAPNAKEERLFAVLAAHNLVEEEDFYIQLDGALSDKDREQVFARMG